MLDACTNAHAADKYEIPYSLRRQWRLLVVGTAAPFPAALYVLHLYRQPKWAWTGGLLAAFTLLLVLGYVYRHLDENRCAGARSVLPQFGAGNLVTLVRGVLAAGLASFVGAPYPTGFAGWLPGLVFLLIATGDSVDGYLARRYAHTTILGRKFDLMVDSLAALVALLLLVSYGRLPHWFLLIGFAPLIFHGLLWLRNARDQRAYVLPPSIFRRLIGSLFFIFLVVALLPVAPPVETRFTGTCIAFSLALSFGRDWLHYARMRGFVGGGCRASSKAADFPGTA